MKDLKIETEWKSKVRERRSRKPTWRKEMRRNNEERCWRHRCQAAATKSPEPPEPSPHQNDSITGTTLFFPHWPRQPTQNVRFPAVAPGATANLINRHNVCESSYRTLQSTFSSKASLHGWQSQPQSTCANAWPMHRMLLRHWNYVGTLHPFWSHTLILSSSITSLTLNSGAEPKTNTQPPYTSAAANASSNCVPKTWLQSILVSDPPRASAGRWPLSWIDVVASSKCIQFPDASNWQLVSLA